MLLRRHLPGLILQQLRPASTFVVSKANSESGHSVGQRVRKNLSVEKNCNVGKLAGKVAHQIRADRTTTVSTGGPDKINLALKAVMLAQGFLQDSHEGQVLACSAKKVNIDDPRVPRERKFHADGQYVTVLTVWPIAKPPVPPVKAYIATADTNTGIFAGHMKAEMEKHGSVRVQAMGAKAVTKAIKAGIILEVYLSECLSASAEAIAFTAERAEDTGTDNAPIVRTFLQFLRVPREHIL
mmetsp:Transcript_20311/g.45542  ORF Transcript_20311/g.45542 Transcript_20311/m.45542 type:complete len:240 (-) Transcript_20311:6-725(-)